MEHHRCDSTNAPSYSEACFCFVLGVILGADAHNVSYSGDRDLNQEPNDCKPCALYHWFAPLSLYNARSLIHVIDIDKLTYHPFRVVQLTITTHQATRCMWTEHTLSVINYVDNNLLCEGRFHYWLMREQLTEVSWDWSSAALESLGTTTTTTSRTMSRWSYLRCYVEYS